MTKEIIRKLISIYEETQDKLKLLDVRSLEEAEISFNFSKFVRFALNDKDLIDRFIKESKERL